MQPSVLSEPPPNGTWERGVFDYDHLKRDFLPFYTRHFDNQSKATSLFNASTGIWISYEDLESLEWKNRYILDRRLRGAFFWELSADRHAELITATYKRLSAGTYLLSGTSSNGKVASWKPSAVYQVSGRVTIDN
jgi:GH18 family chitinase